MNTADENAVLPVAADADSFAGMLAHQGVSEGAYEEWCATIAAGLALPVEPYAAQISAALKEHPALPVIWLNGQDCNGNIEAFLRSDHPTPTELLLDQISLNYVELLSTGPGLAAEEARAATIEQGGYVLVVEGSVPTGEDGAFCTIGGHAFTDIVREAAANAVKVLSVGTCAAYGGVPAARGGLTGAVDVQTFLGDEIEVIKLPGCPVSPQNIFNTIVHYLTFGEWPALSPKGLPLFAYGSSMHSECPRLDHFQNARFVKEWGDEGHQQGWCLARIGCKGPQAKINCASVQFNGHTSFPVNSGAPCIGCVNDGFWDKTKKKKPAAKEKPAAAPKADGPKADAPATSTTVDATVPVSQH